MPLRLSVLGRLLRALVHLLALILPRPLKRWVLLRPFGPARSRLAAARVSPARSQERTLMQIVEANRQTEFGRAHGFDQVQGAASFAARVPRRTYREIWPFVLRHQQGEAGVLVAAPLVGFALTGTGRYQAQLVPVTRATLKLWAWADALLSSEAISRHPGVARGCCLHILPCFKPDPDAAPSPEPASATAADAGPRPGAALPPEPERPPAAPLPVLLQSAGSPGWPSLPPAVSVSLFSVPEEQMRYYWILRLGLMRPVTMLRAACPGTLTLLAEHLEKLGERLVQEVAEGRIEGFDALPEALRRDLPPKLRRPAPRLARRLRRRLQQQGRLSPADLWPNLRVLACATRGPSAPAADRLADRFGSLTILDPGLRTAEAIVTGPGPENRGGPVLPEGQYLEFLPVGGGEQTLGMMDLRPGQRYQPVVTQPSGLYRYVLEELVEVLGLEPDGLPRLAAAGRARHRIPLGSGPLAEEAVTEAVLDACRKSDVVLSAFTSWVEHPDPSPDGTGPPADGSLPRPGLWGRLLSRLRSREASGTRPGRARPSLALAVEPARALDERQARSLLSALQAELRKASVAYDADQRERRMERAWLVVLCRGAFARRQHRLLAEGAPDGHAPAPALADGPCAGLGEEEVMLEIRD